MYLQGDFRVNIIAVFFAQSFESVRQSDVNLPPNSLDSADVANVLRLVWTITGILSVLFVVVGGLKYTLSNGDSNQVSSAKDTVLYAIIGLVLSLSAFLITSFVLGRL